RSFNKQVRYVPTEEWKAHAAVSSGVVSAGTNIHYTGRRFITADESRAMAPHVVVDAHARVTPVLAGLALGFELQLNNLFDTDYAIIRGYPMPPRHLQLRLTVQPSR
ncbi:MAG: TonB-dependent receptor, partial [Spiribacter salinus]